MEPRIDVHLLTLNERAEWRESCIAIPLALSGVLTPWIAGLGMALSSTIVLLNATRLQKIKA